MENEDKGNDVNTDGKRAGRPLWVRFVHYSIRKARKRKSEKEPEAPADKAARRTATATIFIAFFTLVLVVVSYFQWKEIHEGGKDTHNLAVAAGDQATWTQRLAEAEKIQNDKTQLLADSTQQMATDQGSLLRGTHAAFMNFNAGVDMPGGEISFSGTSVGNGRVLAQKVQADLLVTVRNWPSKTVGLGPFYHHIYRKRVGDGTMSILTPALTDHYTMPNITPQIAANLAKGAAYITVEWKANYRDGFGTEVPVVGPCEAWMYLGRFECASRNGKPGFENVYMGRTSCASIDSWAVERAQARKEDQARCQTN